MGLLREKKEGRVLEFNTNLKKIKPSGIRKLFDLAQGKRDLVSFGIGEPDFITPTHIR